MNQKKAKAIRRYVRSLGKVKVDLPHEPSFNPRTASYPANSFQRAYRQAKRILSSVRTNIINARAGLEVQMAL